MFQKLFKTYRRKQSRYSTRRKNLSSEIERLQKQRDAVSYPHWITEVIKPLAEALVATMPGHQYDILGPFGLCCEVSIWFWKGKQKKDLSNIKSITFTHGGDDICLRDQSQDTGRYPPNSIGEVNGMNHPNVEIPADADLKWFLKRVK